MNGIFFYANSFTQDISAWSIEAVTDMDGLFFNVTKFNQPIGTWNTFKVTSMVSMLYACSSSNNPIGSWDVNSVTDMYVAANLGVRACVSVRLCRTSLFVVAVTNSHGINSW